MKDDNIDIFLSRCFKSAEIEIDTPLSEIEQKITEKVIRNRQIRKRKRTQIAKIAVIIMALGSTSSLLLAPQKVNAFKEQLMQQFTYFDGSINVVLNNGSNQSRALGKMERAIKDIQPKIPFRILTPTYIPEGYEFKSITSPNPENKLVVLSFTCNDSELFFTQTQVSDNFSYSININAYQGKSEQVQVGNHIGNMIKFNNGSCSLTWETDVFILCEISGNISSKEILEIATSI